MRTSSVRGRPLMVVAFAMAALGLVACSHGSSSSASNSGNVDRVAAGASAGSAAGTPAPVPAKGAPAPAVQRREIVRTASLEMRVQDVDHAANAIEYATTTLGGRVDGDDRASADSRRTADLVARVPTAKLDQLIGQVDRFGAETSRTVRGEDMTATPADLDARTATLATSVRRLRELMAHSGTVSDLVALENQLTQRESDLESSQAQQRALADQIDLATLTVHVTSPSAPAAAPSSGPAGFGAAVAVGWRGLVTAVRWLLAVLGYALPFVVPVALLVAIGLVVRRRRRAPAIAPAK